MSELNFEKVFNELKVIEANAVSREKYNQSQNEVKKLESLLIEANNRFLQKAEELKKLKELHELQTLEIDVIKAEKQSLAAEKKTLEVRFDEISLKLKLKTHQYDMLAGQQSNNEVKSTNERPQLTGKKTIVTPTVKEDPYDFVASIGTQTVKEEPSVGAANEPSSLTANPCKRPASDPPAIQTIAKRKKKHFGGDQERIFLCDECLVEWGRQIKRGCDFNHPDVPNPYNRIAMFASSEDLKNHYQQVHEYYRNSEFCCETYKSHPTNYYQMFRRGG